MHRASLTSVVLVLLVACGGSAARPSSSPASGPPPAVEPPPAEPAPVDEPPEPPVDPCVSSGRIDVTGVASPALTVAAGGPVSSATLVIVPDEVDESWGPDLMGRLAAIAPALPYRGLDSASQRALRKLGDDTLLQHIRDAQAARGDRVIGRYAFIMNYGLVVRGGAVVAILEYASSAEPDALGACVGAIVAR